MSYIADNIKSIHIKNVSTDEVVIVKAIKDLQGKVSYENLPPEVEVNIYHYTNEERWLNFTEVIMCLLTMHATLCGAEQIVDTAGNEDDPVLPSEIEYQ